MVGDAENTVLSRNRNWIQLGRSWLTKRVKQKPQIMVKNDDLNPGTSVRCQSDFHPLILEVGQMDIRHIINIMALRAGKSGPCAH